MIAPSSHASGAHFSPNRVYRYMLFRLTEHALVPGKHRRVVFVGLNPSTADEVANDATVRRCIGYATRWGFAEVAVVNVFGLRARNPRRLRESEDPVGRDNDHWIAVECASADLVVCCWGAHAKLRRRGEDVAESLKGINVPLHVLGLTKDGHPKHPLYLKADLRPVPWEGYEFDGAVFAPGGSRRLRDARGRV